MPDYLEVTATAMNPDWVWHDPGMPGTPRALRGGTWHCGRCLAEDVLPGEHACPDLARPGARRWMRRDLLSSLPSGVARALTDIGEKMTSSESAAIGGVPPWITFTPAEPGSVLKRFGGTWRCQRCDSVGTGRGADHACRGPAYEPDTAEPDTAEPDTAEPSEDGPGARETRGTLVYGTWDVDSLVILDELYAIGLAEEVTAIMECTTLGEARQLAPTLGFTWVPGVRAEDDDAEDDDAEDEEPLPDEAAYHWGDTGEAAEGDWPPMPGGYALDYLPHALLNALMAHAGAKVVDTTLNGAYFAVPESREADLISVLRSAGYQARRDDVLIASISA